MFGGGDFTGKDEGVGLGIGGGERGDPLDVIQADDPGSVLRLFVVGGGPLVPCTTG